MAQYLLSVHSVEGEVREPMTDEAMRQGFKQVAILEAEMTRRVFVIWDKEMAVRR